MSETRKLGRRRWLAAATLAGAASLRPSWARAFEAMYDPDEGEDRPTLAPVIFAAHGAPDLVTSASRGPAYHAWGTHLPPCTGVVAMTPHFRSERPCLGAIGPGHALFRFPRRFLPDRAGLDYASPDNEALAGRVRGLLDTQLSPPSETRAGMDHTTWMPLHHLIPDGRVPVLEIAMPFWSPRQLLELGQLLAPLRADGVMLMASGNLTHNLAMLGEPGEPAPWAQRFDEWVKTKLTEGDIDALMDFRRAAPDAYLAHPDDGAHYGALAFALGAAVAHGQSLRASFPIEGFSPGSISNRCVEFG